MTLDATITLVGGGPGAMLALRKQFKAALPGAHEGAKGKAAKPLVAYVGAASNDNPGFLAMLRGALAATGATIKLAALAGRHASASDAKSLLAECDLVFVSGGDVEHGMKVLEDRDVVTTLRDLAAAGKPMFGLSAGSLMLARDWVRFPDEDDESTAELFPCLGIAPVHVDAHSEEDGWSELRILVRLLHVRGDEAPVGLGLTRKGGIVVPPRPGAAPVALGTDIPRFVVRRGAVVEGAPLRLKKTPEGVIRTRA